MSLSIKYTEVELLFCVVNDGKMTCNMCLSLVFCMLFDKHTSVYFANIIL